MFWRKYSYTFNFFNLKMNSSLFYDDTDLSNLHWPLSFKCWESSQGLSKRSEIGELEADKIKIHSIL